MKWHAQRSCWQQDIKPREYIAAVGKGTGILVSISYLFYHSMTMNVILLPILAVYLHIWNKECIKRKEQDFQLQFKEGIQMLAAALGSGYSVENAIKEALRDLKTLYTKDTRILKEFSYMVHQLGMNMTAEKVLAEFAGRIRQEDVKNFVSVFSVAKRSGGDSIQIIQKAVRTICDKIEVKREIDTVMSAKKLEFQVMSVIPFGILGYMRLSFPEFMEVLYGNLLGFLIMTGCLGAYLAAYLLGRRMVDIEV